MIDATTKAYIQEHLKDNPLNLALKPTPNGVNKQVALEQIEAYQKALIKLPTLAQNQGIIYPPRISMEQCSSEYTALYKKNVLHELVSDCYSILDLTGGFGIDAYYMDASTYIEQNARLCSIAKHNFQLLNKQINIINSTAENYLQTAPKHDIIYIDPARRDENGNKVFLLNDCSPAVTDLLPLLFKTAPRIIIKLSPMLDITSIINQLQRVMRIDVISVENECKELLVILKNDYVNAPIIRALNINKDGTYSTFTEGSYENERSLQTIYATTLSQYLYEPYAAYIKSGLDKTISKQFNISQLARDTHLYTSEHKIKDFVGRRFEIIDALEFNNRAASQYFKNNPKANITTRNFPISVAELRKKYSIKEGGDIYAFFTTLCTNKKVIIITRKC